MNSSVRNIPHVSGDAEHPEETREEKIQRIRSQVTRGFYTKHEVLRDVADALLMNPAPFENLNEKEN